MSEGDVLASWLGRDKGSSSRTVRVFAPAEKSTCCRE